MSGKGGVVVLQKLVMHANKQASEHHARAGGWVGGATKHACACMSVRCRPNCTAMPSRAVALGGARAVAPGANSERV